MSDPWGLDDDQPPAEAIAPAHDDMSAQLDDLGPPGPAIRCLNCGEVHSTCRERAADLLRSRIRAEARDRLLRTEAALEVLGEVERIGVARWLQSALDRPPLSSGRLDYLRSVIDALWRDIYWLTPDPLSPTFEFHGETWTVAEPHHELAEMRDGEWVGP